MAKELTLKTKAMPTTSYPQGTSRTRTHPQGLTHVGPGSCKNRAFSRLEVI